MENKDLQARINILESTIKQVVEAYDHNTVFQVLQDLINPEEAVEPKEDLWTLERFNRTPHGTIMTTGTIKNSEEEGVFITHSNPGGMMRWVAVKGSGDDWVIYIHWAHREVDDIRRHGDKVRDINNVAKILRCDILVLNKYRH